MPSYRHHDHGNLYIQFEVVFPERLGGPDGGAMTDDQRAALESVLPKRMAGPTPPADAMTEDFTLDDVDPTREAQRAHAHALEEEEEDGMGGGGERVQCASQ